MKILKVFDQAELVLVDLEVNLGNKTQSSPTLCIKMDGKIIEKVDNFNFLGITISETMSWKAHIEKISVKISKVIGVMCRIKNFVNSNILLKIYSSLVENIYN